MCWLNSGCVWNQLLIHYSLLFVLSVITNQVLYSEIISEMEKNEMKQNIVI